MINGGENSHDLPSAKGRPMKAGGIIQSEFKPGEPGALMSGGRITLDSST